MAMSDSIDRRDVNKWNNPHREEIGRMPMYSPVHWVFIVIDLAILFRWWVWHKRRSLQTRRWVVSMNTAQALQQCSLLRQSDNLTHHQKEQLETIQRKLLDSADEMSLQSDQIERFRPDDDRGDA